KNLRIRQNTTIGIKSLTDEPGMVYIGDNVDIGANSCIIGNISIGDNVIIGAMSFINKDIPPDTLVYTRKETTLIRQKCGMT
ncbi:serine acetyltransferase, partial [Escherichia coli]|nr:serine acetyltransferase [Escherichia coli]